MKQKILGTPLGRAMLSLREKFNIVHTAYFYPERVGRKANDQLAMKLLTSLCQSNKTFIDVGAHIGSIIAEVMLVDSSIKIVAIEAIPEKVEKLRQKFSSIELYGCAVADFTGEASFFINTKQSGYSSLREMKDIAQKDIREIRVPVQKLDDLVLFNNIDVIKVDVEGGELGVLRGAIKILNNNRPVIMFESGPQLPEDNFKYTKEDLYDFLHSNDYAVIIPNRLAHNDTGLSKDGFIESHLYPLRTTNYFAIPQERRVEVRDKARKILNI